MSPSAQSVSRRRAEPFAPLKWPSSPGRDASIFQHDEAMNAYSPMPQVCSALLCGALLLIAGCSNPSSQNLASPTVTAKPSTVSVGGAWVLKAVARQF